MSTPTPERSSPSADTIHEYDGIREYDNPTPGWWYIIFFGSIVFSWFYYLFAQFSPMMSSPQDTWAEAQVAEYKRIFGAVGDLTNDEATLLSLTAKSDMMAVAQGMFQSNCAQCHAKDGGGINGVNLTDNHYKSVTTITDIHTIITEGAANGAMPSWRNTFSENERVLLSAYIAHLRGTTPAAPKGPEGTLIDPWPTAAAGNK